METIPTTEVKARIAELADLLSDDEALADLRQSREDFASGDTFSMEEVRGELEARSNRAA
jgi:antitoxin YefM